MMTFTDFWIQSKSHMEQGQGCLVDAKIAGCYLILKSPLFLKEIVLSIVMVKHNASCSCLSAIFFHIFSNFKTTNFCITVENKCFTLLKSTEVTWSLLTTICCWWSLSACLLLTVFYFKQTNWRLSFILQTQSSESILRLLKQLHKGIMRCRSYQHFLTPWQSSILFCSSGTHLLQILM